MVTRALAREALLKYVVKCPAWSADGSQERTHPANRAGKFWGSFHVHEVTQARKVPCLGSRSHGTRSDRCDGCRHLA